MENDIVSAIKNIIANDLFINIPVDQIQIEDGLQSVIGIDSIGFAELRFQCENKFNIEIGDDEFNPENFHNIKTLSVLIQKRLISKE